MIASSFEKEKHIYKNDAFVELVKDAIRFFNGTPVHGLPPADKFSGVGVYALYYTGSNPMYNYYADANRLSYSSPIYVGKAVPKGWRQSRKSHTEGATGAELRSRLNQHASSIKSTNTLDVSDFKCRFVMFEGDGSDMIGTIEAALIKLHKPLWNSALDGFGNHDPGRGRYNQANSDWDVMHKGRSFAENLTGTPKDKAVIIANVNAHYERLRSK